MRYGRQYLHRAVFGEADLLDMVAWDAVWEDPTLRKRVAELALEKLEVEVDAAVGKLRGTRPHRSDLGRQLLQGLKHRSKGEQALETEIVKAVGAAVGPGGALTVLVGGGFSPPVADRQPALPTAKGRGDSGGAESVKPGGNSRRGKRPGTDKAGLMGDGTDTPSAGNALGGAP